MRNPDEQIAAIKDKWRTPERHPSNGVPLFKMGQRVWRESCTVPDGYESHKIVQIIIDADGAVFYRFQDDPKTSTAKWPPINERRLYPSPAAAEWVFRRNMFNCCASEAEIANLKRARAEAAFRAVTLSKEDKEFLEKVGEWKC